MYICLDSQIIKFDNNPMVASNPDNLIRNFMQLNNSRWANKTANSRNSAPQPSSALRQRKKIINHHNSNSGLLLCQVEEKQKSKTNHFALERGSAIIMFENSFVTQ